LSLLDCLPNEKLANKEKTGRGKTQQKSPLRKAGGQFLDHLGKAAVDKLKVKLGLNTETKYLYDAIGGSVLTNVLSAAMVLPVIPQGVTPVTRVGSSLRITKLRYNYSISAASTTTGAVAVRIIFAYRNIAPGASITAANLLQTTSDSNSLYAYGFLTKTLGIRILSDRLHYVGVPSSDIGTVCDSFSWAPETFEVEYNLGDTTGVVANVLRGDIVMMVMYGAVAGTLGTAPSIAVDRVTEFVDN